VKFRKKNFETKHSSERKEKPVDSPGIASGSAVTRRYRAVHPNSHWSRRHLSFHFYRYRRRNL